MNGISSFLMGSAPAGAGKGLCDRPLQPFAARPYSLLLQAGERYQAFSVGSSFSTPRAMVAGTSARIILTHWAMAQAMA